MAQASGFDVLGNFVMPIMTKPKNDQPICAGSCVIICVAIKRAIALTAKHVLDFVEQLNGRDDTSELRVSPHFRKKRLDEVFKPIPAGHNTTFKHETFVMLPNERSLALMMASSCFPGGELDIAAIGLEIGIGPAERFPLQCRMMSQGPAVGDPVLLCGFPKGNAGTILDDASGFNFEYKMQTIKGHVTERFDWGEDYFVRSPGFRIDVAAPSGFSGGAVLYLHREYGPVLCGIISASDEQSTSAAIMFPALALNNVMPHDASVPDTLLGLCSLPGALSDLHDAPSHMKVFNDQDFSSLKDTMAWMD